MDGQTVWFKATKITVVIYKALYLGEAQGRINGVSNETRTHSFMLASQAC